MKNLLTTIGNVLFGKAPDVSTPSSLRNKQGGMAWIKPHMQGTGAEVLTGQIVRTVRLEADGFWLIDPMPRYIARARVVFPTGFRANSGDVVTVRSLHDEVLEPIHDAGISDSEVRDLWSTKQKETV